MLVGTSKWQSHISGGNATADECRVTQWGWQALSQNATKSPCHHGTELTQGCSSPKPPCPPSPHGQSQHWRFGGAGRMWNRGSQYRREEEAARGSRLLLFEELLFPH